MPVCCSSKAFMVPFALFEYPVYISPSQSMSASDVDQDSRSVGGHNFKVNLLFLFLYINLELLE